MADEMVPKMVSNDSKFQILSEENPSPTYLPDPLFLVCLRCENEQCWWLSDPTSALLDGTLVRLKLPVIPPFFSLTMNFAFFSMPENGDVWLFQFSV